jgi:hypothetical protein
MGVQEDQRLGVPNESCRTRLRHKKVVSNLEIDLFRMGVEGTQSQIHEYQSMMESQLSFIKKAEEQRLASLFPSSDGLEVEFDLALDDFRWTHEFMFPRFFRYSFVVLLVLLLENQLNGICRMMRERHSLALKCSDFAGSPIERCKIYLGKYAQIPLNETSWRSMEDLVLVRNCIVHTLGQVTLSRDATRLREITGQGLQIKDDFGETDILVINSEYCDRAAIEEKRFFTELLDAAGFATYPHKK